MRRATSTAVLSLGIAFLVSSPLSLATALPFSAEAKYARVLSTIFALTLSLPALGNGTGRGGRWLAAFVLTFWLAALWSTAPFTGLVYKGFVVLTVGAGLGFAYALGSVEQARTPLRFVAVVAALSGLLVLIDQTSGGGTATHERAASLGINPNALGSSAATLLPLALFVGLFDSSQRWVWIGRAATLLLGGVILATGSRASVAMAVVGLGALCIPLAERPARLLVVGAACAGLFLVVQEAELGGAERLATELTKDTRGRIWSSGWRHFTNAPAIGVGWVNHGGRAGSVQNLYLQVALETGLVGFGLLVAFLVAVGVRARRTLRLLAERGWSTKWAYLAISLGSSVLLHGMAESSALLGTTINSFVLGVSVGLLDRVHDGAVVAARPEHAPVAPPGAGRAVAVG